MVDPHASKIRSPSSPSITTSASITNTGPVDPDDHGQAAGPGRGFKPSYLLQPPHVRLYIDSTGGQRDDLPLGHVLIPDVGRQRIAGEV
jgi:hypothetical protein